MVRIWRLAGGLGEADAVMVGQHGSHKACQDAGPGKTTWLGPPEMGDDFD